MGKTLVTVNLVINGVPDHALADLARTLDEGIRDGVLRSLNEKKETLPPEMFEAFEAAIPTMIEFYGAAVLPIRELPRE